MNGDKKVVGELTVADFVESLTALAILVITFSILFKWG